VATRWYGRRWGRLGRRVGVRKAVPTARAPLYAGAAGGRQKVGSIGRCCVGAV